MVDVAQVKAAIPRDLKRRAFAAFALREDKFNRWLQRELEQFLQVIDAQASEGKECHSNTSQYTTTPECAAPGA